MGELRLSVDVGALPALEDPANDIRFHRAGGNIRDVWAHNLEEEFAAIRRVVERYPFIAMDTEFPGVVARPLGSGPREYQYNYLRWNVNVLKIIQLGLTFLDEAGNVPPDGPMTWQFNFKFSLDEDLHATDSIELLEKSGIDFPAFARDGIEIHHFAELMIPSGLVLLGDANPRWLSFHSSFDFGYLLRALTGQDLPPQEDAFHQLLVQWFGSVYDMKYMVRMITESGDSSLTNSGLMQLAEDLELSRIGQAHQAGSDSLLTGHAFFKLVHDEMRGVVPDACRNVLFNLGRDARQVVGGGDERDARGQPAPAVVVFGVVHRGRPVPVNTSVVDLDI